MTPVPGSLDWSLVPAFLAVAEEGSLSAAARRLKLSQPTLGRQIKALEERLGAELFIRQSRGLTLSQTGASLVDAARAMRDAAAQLEMIAAGQEDRLGGTVRITASVAMATWHLPSIVAEIRRAEPGIAVEVVASDESRNLLFREADIAVRMFRPTQLDIVARHIGDMELGLYAAQSYLSGRNPVAGLQDRLDLDWVGYDTLPQIIEGMRDAGLEVDRDFFAVRCDDNNVYWNLVRAGCGLGFGQKAIAALCPEVVELDLGTPLPTLPVWLCTAQSIRRTPRIARVWDLLVEGLAPLVP